MTVGLYHTFTNSARVSHYTGRPVIKSSTHHITEDIGYYDYRPVTLLFACFIRFQHYALS